MGKFIFLSVCCLGIILYYKFIFEPDQKYKNEKKSRRIRRTAKQNTELLCSKDKTWTDIYLWIRHANDPVTLPLILDEIIKFEKKYGQYYSASKLLRDAYDRKEIKLNREKSNVY